MAMHDPERNFVLQGEKKIKELENMFQKFLWRRISRNYTTETITFKAEWNKNYKTEELSQLIKTYVR